ncbi:MAG: cytochrome c-type biogenesis protein CcmH [Microthrixaceae bacterium]
MKKPSSQRHSQRHGQRQKWWWWSLMGVILVVLLLSASGTSPTEGTSDDRLFALAAQIKCVQCVGESVAGSAAPIAVQFRSEISSQMKQGRTNDEILNFFAERYEGVLLTPPSSGLGSLVWVLPVIAAAAAALLLADSLWVRRSRGSAQQPSSEDESLVKLALEDRRSGTDRTEAVHSDDS